MLGCCALSGSEPEFEQIFYFKGRIAMRDSESETRPLGHSPIGEIAFWRNDAVVIKEGNFHELFGAVVSLKDVGADPVYVVQLSDGQRVEVAQSKLLSTKPEESSGGISELIDWYHSVSVNGVGCEPSISIRTLDSLGWSVTIDLVRLGFGDVPFQPISEMDDPDGWFECQVLNNRFEATCAPLQLERVIRAFLRWEKSHQHRR